MRHIFIAVILLMGISVGAAGAETGAKAYRCSFPVLVTTRFEEGEWWPEQKTQDFSFALAAIDRENRTAQIVGNVGAENLSLIVGLEHETFIEISLSGTVQLTVVFTELPQPPDGRFPAVHSRHARAAAPAHPKLCVPVYSYLPGFAVVERDTRRCVERRAAGLGGRLCGRAASSSPASAAMPARTTGGRSGGPVFGSN